MSPFPSPFTATQKSTFAYTTIARRLPEILGKIIASCENEVLNVKNIHGQDGAKDGAEVIGKITRLRNRLMSNEHLEEFDDHFVDSENWQNSLKIQTKKLGETPCWFEGPWLYVESYMYRYIYHCLLKSKFMQKFDPFMEMKNQSIDASTAGMQDLSRYLLTTCNNGVHDLQGQFKEFMQISLWANRNDLSLSCGETETTINPSESLLGLEKFILDNHSNDVWSHVEKLHNSQSKVRMDFILDNSGMEFFSDLVFADFLLVSGLAHQVVFWPKAMPWYISDVTPADLPRLLKKLSGHQDANIRECADRWTKRFDAREFKMESDLNLIKFFTLANSFCDMSQVAPNLYKELAKSDLVFIKGDLNYRKLVGDLNWETTARFDQALMGFEPASLCALRTVKADVIVGLPQGMAEGIEKEESDWLITGKYALIQSLIKS